MSNLYDMRSGTLVKSKLYTNGLNISDVLIKGPLLQADFTTGTYNSNGAAKTFADLFAFTRAGKAWLVKDTGLQEYAADVPRLDNGLLIEESATNYFTQSDMSESLVAYKNNVAFTNGYWQRVDSANSAVIYKIPPVIPLGQSVTVTLHTLDDNLFSVFNIANKFNDLTLAASKKQQLTYTADRDASGYSGLNWGMNSNIGAVAKYVQFEFSPYSTSFILTAESPVTRPADYLLNNITGTTVTGDWDSTLTLSIVAGKLVHSGYGRIRSLEIN